MLLSGVSADMETRGIGPGLVTARSLAVEATGTYVVVDEASEAVLRIDPATGDRVVLLPRNTAPVARDDSVITFAEIPISSPRGCLCHPAPDG